MRAHRWIGAATLLAVMNLPAGAQRRDRQDHDREPTSRIDTTLTLARGGTVDLSLVSGEIVVTGWTRGEVRLRATSERGRLDLSTSSNRIALEVRSDRGRMGDTRYEVTVPAGPRVLMRSVSGDISARDVRGEVEASSVSGQVEVRNAATRVTAGSVSGDVQVSGVAGPVRANAVSGDVSVENVQGDVSAETVSGDIVLDQITSRSIRTKSVSGDIHYDGSFESAGRYEFNSHSGDIRLVVPADLGALLTLQTFSGEIHSDFELTFSPTSDERRSRARTMTFTMGRGGARIDIETFSGDVRLERRVGRSR